MKILFIVPDMFLRTIEKTDPFYDPIIRVVDEMPRMEWRVLLPRKGMACGYPQEKIGNYKWFLWCSIWFYRFWRLLNRKTPVWKINYCFGKLTRPLFKKKFDADIIITQAGILATELAGMFPHKRIVDVQHGVIYSTHSGYFTPDARLVKQYQFTKNREFWVYGKGYADCFFKHPDNARDLEGRVHVIGDVCMHEVVPEGFKDTIVVSGQFKPEAERECLLDQVRGLREFLQSLQTMRGDNVNVLIKHHPRFKGIDELDKLYEEYPFFSETNEDWNSLYGRMLFHVTFSSTVVFDAASNGIVSYLMDSETNDPVLEKSFWSDDYHYPYHDIILSEVLDICAERDTAIRIRQWYEKFYEPFEEKKCLELINERMFA